MLRAGRPSLFREKDPTSIIEKYESFWEYGRRDFAHYFRYLFNVFRFIDKSKFKEDTYWKLVRAMLSDEELALIFYNCFSERGRPFRRYALKFHLFDNLPPEILMDPRDLEFVEVWREEEAASLAVTKV